MKRHYVLVLVVLVAGCVLGACGAPSAAQQFGSANATLAAAWSRYFDGTKGEEGLSALSWVEGQSSTTLDSVNQWLDRSSHLATAIAKYDANIGSLSTNSPYRSDLDALVRAGSNLISDLRSYEDEPGQPVCNLVGCTVTPLQDGNPWNTEWLNARQDETTVYADFGLSNTNGGPYSPPFN